MTTSPQDQADIVAGWATGIGIGFAVFMVGWILANRLFGYWLAAPAGPVLAMGTAILAGTVTAARYGRLLAARFRRD